MLPKITKDTFPIRRDKLTSPTYASAKRISATITCTPNPARAFFPETDEAAAHMTIQLLPMEGQFELTATYAQGVEDSIFTHA